MLLHQEFLQFLQEPPATKLPCNKRPPAFEISPSLVGFPRVCDMSPSSLQVFIPCVFRFLCFPPPRSTETNGPTSVLMWRQESSEERRLVVEGWGGGGDVAASVSGERRLSGSRSTRATDGIERRCRSPAHGSLHTREEALTINFQLKCIASGAFN